MSLRRFRGLAIGMVLCACARTHPQPPASPQATDDVSIGAALTEAATGVEDQRLVTLLRDHWSWHLRDHPEQATRMGVHAYDDRIHDESIGAERGRAGMRRELLGRLVELGASPLSAGDALTASLLESRLRWAIATEVCAFERWRVNARTNPLERFNELPRLHPWRNATDGDALLGRYRAIPGAIDDAAERLRSSVVTGLVADQESLRRTVHMLDEQLAKPIDDWPLLQPTTREPPPGWAASAHAALLGRLREIVRDEIEPALVRYRNVVRDELMPFGRTGDQIGVSSLPEGSACYAALIEQHTSLPLSAEEVHARGLAEIERIDEEIATLGAKALGTEDLAATLERLRSDRALFFETAEEVETAARQALAGAEAAMPRWFGRLPQAPCVVQRIPDYKAPFTTIAYYDPPHTDGSKPGEYFVNVYEPHTRPRYEARVLAFHESIPGHHLQIAIAQELAALPAFRRHAGYTAFVEGWALYTERLADEMGLYETDLDRLGMLSFDAWRAARLVVDTGIHAHGWTRERAEQFMLEHTALAPNNIANEVDRYIGWPGQALAYKIGQLEILELRRQAETVLGDAFAIAELHDEILGAGALPLPQLAARIETWLERRASQ
jgi:uncharacterized protein (DUF885 family)